MKDQHPRHCKVSTIVRNKVIWWRKLSTQKTTTSTSRSRHLRKDTVSTPTTVRFLPETTSSLSETMNPWQRSTLLEAKAKMAWSRLSERNARLGETAKPLTKTHMKHTNGTEYVSQSFPLSKTVISWERPLYERISLSNAIMKWFNADISFVTIS